MTDVDIDALLAETYTTNSGGNGPAWKRWYSEYDETSIPEYLKRLKEEIGNTGKVPPTKRIMKAINTIGSVEAPDRWQNITDRPVVTWLRQDVGLNV